MKWSPKTSSPRRKAERKVQMEEFDNLKMEHAFMKVKLLIYNKKNKRNPTEQWESYKKQVKIYLGGI
jgi:signal recognition particle subunit SEC65